MRDSFGFADLGRALTGMAVGTGLLPAAVLPRFFRRLPRAVTEAYKVIRKTPYFGPNIKNLATAVLPVGTVLIVPLASVVSVFAGTALGAWYGINKTPGDIAKEVFKTADEVDQKWVNEVLPGIANVTPDALPEGTEPFDVSPLRALGAFGTGLTTAVVEGPAMTGIYLYRMPGAWLRASRRIFREQQLSMVLLAVFLEVGLTKIAILGAPLALVGGTAVGLGAGCKRGYQEGFTGAWVKVGDDLRTFDKMMADIAGD